MAQIHTKYVRIKNCFNFAKKTKTKKQNSYRSVFELGEEILNLKIFKFVVHLEKEKQKQKRKKTK